jgi:hypothetical protein
LKARAFSVGNPREFLQAEKERSRENRIAMDDLPRRLEQR